MIVSESTQGKTNELNLFSISQPITEAKPQITCVTNQDVDDVETREIEMKARWNSLIIVEKWRVKTELKSNMKHGHPFQKQFPSFNVTAIILSFVDRRTHICQMLQVLNHQSRMYIVSQNSLAGFLQVYHNNVIGWLRELYNAPHLNEDSVSLQGLNTGKMLRQLA